MKLVRIALILVLAALTSRVASAETPTREQLETQISVLKESVATLEGDLKKRKSELYRRYETTKMKEYDYQARIMDLNSQLFATQWLQGYVTMFLVVAIVISGLCFSAFQLWTTVRVGIQPNSELEMSAKSVRVNSSVVGVVVLVISIVFLFIYVQYVYTFKFIDPFTPNISEPKDS